MSMCDGWRGYMGGIIVIDASDAQALIESISGDVVIFTEEVGRKVLPVNKGGL